MTLLLHTTLAVACLTLSVVAEPDVVSATATQTSITLTGKPFNCTCTEHNRELFTLMRANPEMFQMANITTCSNLCELFKLTSYNPASLAPKAEFNLTVHRPGNCSTGEIEICWYVGSKRQFNVGRLFMGLGITFGCMCFCISMPLIPAFVCGIGEIFKSCCCRKHPPRAEPDSEEEEYQDKAGTPLSPVTVATTSGEAPPPYESV